MYDELAAKSKNLIENERLKNRIESNIRQYECIISESKYFASQLHEESRQRLIVHDLIAEGDSEAALKYINELVRSRAELYDTVITKRNPALDMLLRRKMQEAIKSRIMLNCIYEAETAIPIDDMSLCLIFGNALDNAIEACEKLPDDEEKRIDVYVAYINNRLVIQIANTSPPVGIADNHCDTTKEDKLMHGHGLNNIQKIIEQYEGNFVIQYDNGMFTMSIIFFLSIISE
jgi:sensor histidine kinase regulating citrate/malate metabolism